VATDRDRTIGNKSKTVYSFLSSPDKSSNLKVSEPGPLSVAVILEFLVAVAAKRGVLLVRVPGFHSRVVCFTVRLLGYAQCEFSYCGILVELASRRSGAITLLLSCRVRCGLVVDGGKLSGGRGDTYMGWHSNEF
jgi:hypothetical protein